MDIIKNRYEFVMFLEAKYCNPNGDPDFANYPRQDQQTEYGYITPMAIKRRIRDYVLDKYHGKSGKNVVIRTLNNINEDIFVVTKEAETKNRSAYEIICEEFWDARTFGGVLATGKDAGSINGPVQIQTALTIDPIEIIDASITTPKREGNYDTLEKYRELWESKKDTEKRTFGRMPITPYGLYMIKGHISANLAEKTKFSEDDLKLLFEALLQAYNNCNTMTKAGVNPVGPVIIFKHVGTNYSSEEDRENEAKLGCDSAQNLFKLISISKKEDVEYPRDSTDYNISINVNKLTNGVEIGFKTRPFEPISWGVENLDDDWIKIIK